MNDFPFSQTQIPALSKEQMIEVDRAMIEDMGISLIQMMENAGRCLAELARVHFLAGDPRGKRVMVMAGSGGNGGGALVAARRLHNYGADVEVMLARDATEFAPVPAQQLSILRHMNIPIHPASYGGPIDTPQLIIDGIIGYSLKGAPRGDAAALIRRANASFSPVLALDVPSGLDAGTGETHDPTIRAEATLTLALPKHGLLGPLSAGLVGRLYLADISVPPSVYKNLGMDVGYLFAQSDIIRLS